MANFATVVPGRLYQITDLLAQNHVAEILATDWMSIPYQLGPVKETGVRRELAWDHSLINHYSDLINQQLPVVNQALGTHYTRSGGQFWIDLPGFTCSLHTDGHLANSMQIYWQVPGPNYGTGFYHFKDPAQVLYQFQSLPNSGYIMLNHLDDTGAQPLQWHGMLNPVPDDTIRVSSYWQFE